MCNASTLHVQSTNQISNVWLHLLKRYGLGPESVGMGDVTLAMPHSGMTCRQQAGTCYR